jgi:hypothetical protein
MNKVTKIVLLSLIAITQVATLVGGFFAYEHMSQTLSRLRAELKALYEEIHGGLIVDFVVDPNPFAPLIPLVILGLLLTAVLLADQIRHKNT